MSGSSDAHWTRLEQLFAELVELEPAAQARRLDAMETRERALADELRTLLTAHDDTSDEFLAPPPQHRSVTHESAAGEEGDALVGQTIGSFRIVRRLGTGGMSTVYLATQRHPERSVALKMLRPALASATPAHRFRQEIDVLSELEHPGIARLIDAGTCELHGVATPWLALELIEGARPITAVAGERDGRDRIRLFLDAAKAVAWAHRRAVIHRDLKPANILVGRDDTVKVIDFGIARLVGEQEARMTHDTPNAVLGTLAYMSPEQFEDPRAADTRSDVYSLGVVLHEMLTGRLPYPEVPKSVAQASRFIALGQLVIDTRVNGSKDLAAIVRRALATDRDQRYDTVQAFIEDLQRFLDGLPIASRSIGFAGQIRLLAARYRAATLGILVAALALVVATVVSLNQAHRANVNAEAADLAREDADRRTALAQLANANDALRLSRPAQASLALAQIDADDQDWLWSYLSARTDQSVEVHNVPARAARGSFAPDGSAVQTTMVDGDAVAIDVMTLDGPAPRRQFSGAPGKGACATFLADSDLVLRIEYRHELSIWRRSTGEKLRSFVVPAVVTDVFAIEGSTLSIVCQNQHLMHVDLQSMTLAGHCALPPGQCTAIGVARGMATAVLRGGVVVRFDVTTSEVAARWTIAGGGGDAALVSDDGARVAMRTSNGQLVIFDARQGTELRRTAHMPSSIAPLSMRGETVLAGDPDGVLHLISARPDVPIQQFLGHTGGIVAAQLIDDRRFVSLGADGTVRRWHADQHGQPVRLIEAASPVTALTMDDRVIVAATETNLSVFDQDSLACVAHLHLADRLAAREVVCDGPDHVIIARQTASDLLRVNWRDGTMTTIAHDARAWHLAMSPDGRTLAVARAASVGTSLIDLETGDLTTTDTPWMVSAVAWLDDDHVIEAGYEGVRILNRATGVVREVINESLFLVRGIDLSPDGSTLAIGCHNGRLIIVDLESGARRESMTRASISEVCFSPSGRTLLTVGEDRQVKAWHAASLEYVTALEGHRTIINAAAFTPDGRAFITAAGAHGSASGRLLVWPRTPAVRSLKPRPPSVLMADG